jgi:predicted DNA-binding protein
MKRKRLPQFSLAMTDEQKKQLEEVCSHLGVSQAEMIRTSIRQLWESIPR